MLKKLLLKNEDLSAEIWNAFSLILGYDQLPLDVGDLLLSANNLSNLLLIVNLAFIKCGLLDLDLLIEDLKLLISLNQLRTQNVTFIDYHLVVFLLLLFLLLGLGDNKLETRNVALLGLNHVVTGCDRLLDFVDVTF